MEYAEAVYKFHDIYDQARDKYGLRHHIVFSLYDDSFIRVYASDGDTERRIVNINKVEEMSEAQCYLQAAAALERYIREKEKKQ